MEWPEMKLFIHVLGMFILGVAGLLMVDALHQRRVTEPFPDAMASAAEPPLRPTGTSGNAAADIASMPASRAMAGVKDDLSAFVGAIRGGRRAEAMQVLDGAFHVADVLHAAMPTNDPSATLFAHIDRIRRSVQNDAIGQALENAGEAAAVVTASRIDTDPRAPSTLTDYVGAAVITSVGAPAGTVVGASGDTVRVTNPDVHRVLGFLMVSDTPTRDLPVDAVLFGALRPYRRTMVVDSTR